MRMFLFYDIITYILGVENLIDKASVFLHYLVDKSINAVTSSLYLLN
jgi:hypothetical protein